MQGVGQTRLMVDAPATLFLLSNISLKLRVVWPAVWQRGFGDHPGLLCCALQPTCFVHFEETMRSKLVGPEAREKACVAMSLSETGRVTLAPENTSLTTWCDLVPAAPMPVRSSPFAKITLSVASRWMRWVRQVCHHSTPLLFGKLALRCSWRSLESEFGAPFCKINQPTFIIRLWRRLKASNLHILAPCHQ